jgi:hypothetical protein
MADDSTNKTISSTDSGFPDYLNFDTLRSEAIAYLGNLSGKIWTDYNVHDPGITILEALIYAVLDLGYRTNLPAVDLFTKNPDDTSRENNFFTPSQILSNNPLTIIDFRKLLIDIKGVKNAWLETEDKLPVNFCKNNNASAAPGVAVDRIPDPCKDEFLNGLYHVFIELEKDYNLKVEKQADEYNDIIYNIKCALMSHRNLCEDFIDIKILCKLQIGLCADIELNNDATGEDVYAKILADLREFFSPAPKFYTLPQLLEKGKPIENIFAGRPYDIKESYGFVDTDELEQLPLRKKIHLSDVYHLLFDIKGVKNVRNLSWSLCSSQTPQGDIINKWELLLPENFIPEFDIGCSGFQFFKYGMRVKVDTSKANSIFEMNFSENGKILYHQPSPYLDAQIPQGVYRTDLADYHSIQNEFPHVYGIREGDLSATASDERKAQALQLQGFLLFFDQLLANYLSQLKNIRSLFAMSSSENDDDNHTYFTNKLTDVPQLEKLLRFNAGIGGSKSLGSDGSVLAFPTGRKNVETLISSGKIQNTDLDRRCNDVNKDDFPPYRFCYKTDMQQAENQLRDDLLNGDFDPVIIANYNDCYFFYCFTSSPDFVIISKKYYSSEKEAQTAAASVKYLATFQENYRPFIIEDDNSNTQFFSFDLEFNLNSYAQFLKLMSEDASLYSSRRQGFLNHLLSRFAEQFTDYALLNAGFLTADQLQKAQIKAEEKFLTNYPDLSSNRGRAYNYKCNGWENENISGFEKRVKALSGIDAMATRWKKHYLCNLVVEKADEIYQLSVTLFGNAFTVEDKMFTYEAGSSSLNSLYKKLSNDPQLQTEYISHEDKWSVFIKDDFGNKYSNQKLFDTQEEADNYINSLHSVLLDKPDPNTKAFVSKFIFKVLFKNYKDDLIEESKQKFETKDNAQKYFTKIFSKVVNHLNNSEEFAKIKKGFNVDKLIPVKNENYSALYIDKNKFQFKSIDVIQLGDVKKKFVMLNDAKTIQFDSLIISDTQKIAESKFEELLRLLCFNENYLAEKDNGGGQFKIVIKNAENEVAVYYQTFASQEEAEDKIKGIFNEIFSHTYHLGISDALPDEWEFEYQLSNPSGKNLEFKTRAGYTSEPQAQAAAKQFYTHLSSLAVKKTKDNLQLVLDQKKKIIADASSTDLPSEETGSQLLQYHQELSKAVNNPTNKFINKILEAGKDTDAEQYIYKLVDKDNLLAKASFAAKNKGEALNHKNDLINTIQAGYDYTTLVFGSDIIDERKDTSTNVSWYHYQLKCNNVLFQKGSIKDNPLILFESVKGYTSREDALQAFQDNYLLILRKAFSDINYGDNQFISLTEILIHEADDCAKEVSTVFVTPETLYEYDGDTAATIKALVLLAKSYPVVYISKGRYKFSLFNKNNETYDWRSTASCLTPQKAMQEFQFFLSLLNYSGNIYIEKNETDCRYYIYIREVLALSATTFDTAEHAWGSDGIEKFICVAQSENGFHNYLNQKNCNHSFYVACGNTGVIHPCKYETPERRDYALNKLYQAARFNFFDLLQLDSDNNLTLNSVDKKPIAKLFILTDGNNAVDKCEKLVQIFEAIYVDKNFDHPANKEVFLSNDGDKKLAAPVSADITAQDWKQQLRDVGCYFPLIKKIADVSDAARNSSACNFYFHIRLPGFNNCKDDLANNCLDKSSYDACVPGCYVAWESDCCFLRCCDALLFYASTLKLINDFSNYKAVHDCNCGNYGIELHTEQMATNSEIKSVTHQNDTDSYPDSIVRWLCADSSDRNFMMVNNQNEPVINQRFLNKCLSEIVAFNPQPYNNALVACEAVERAKKLINSEGLHLVEHILLRPRCIEDCDCKNFPSSCYNESDSNAIDKQKSKNSICHFPWKPGGEPDPCAPEDPISFTPGCDPYSFIATIALPAWLQRFRSQENRQVIEKLLQKEAPSHVLLRILWLAPRDFCCFEYYFKNWNHWLAKKMCDPNYSNCDFLGLLFYKKFENLGECAECVPCACNVIPPVSCFDKETEPCSGFDLITQLNELYCWNRNNYETYNCENPDDIQEPGRGTILKAVVADKEEVNPANLPAKPQAEESKKPADAKELPEIDNHQKSLLIQARSNKYLQNVQEIANGKPGNKTAENAVRFFADTNPNAERYEDLINKILKNKSDSAKKIKGLTLKEKGVLIDNISWQYFDRILINTKKADQITALTALFNHLRKNKIDMHSLYDDWNSEELKSVEPEINFNEIKKAVI